MPQLATKKGINTYSPEYEPVQIAIPERSVKDTPASKGAHQDAGTSLLEEDWECYRLWDNLCEEELLTVATPVVLLPSRVTETIPVA